MAFMERNPKCFKCMLKMWTGLVDLQFLRADRVVLVSLREMGSGNCVLSK